MQSTVVKLSENINSYCDHPNEHETVLQLFEEILKFDNLEVLFGFSWGKEIKSEECLLSSLTLTQHDLNIKIPVSIENVKRLKDISLKLASCNKGYNLPFNQSSIRKALEISASEFCCSIQQEINISSLVAYHLQLPTKLMDVQLQRLIMFEPGDQCFLHNCDSSIAENKIGTVIVQLPAEGGHEGGRLNVEYYRNKAAFENHGNSDKNFYLTVFYNCCEEFMEPITKGHKLILVFDLIWTDAKTEIPTNFPVFLTASKAIKQVFKHWIRQNVVNLELDSHHFKNTNQEDSSEVNTSDHLISEWALKEKIVFFILQEAYEDKSVAFELLRGQDRILVELLLNCGFLDVHLAIPTLTIKSGESLVVESEKQRKGEEQDLLEISSLIDSNDVTRNLCFELDWNNHFVGLIQSNQEKDFNENRKDKVERGKRNLHHGILLIWPKHHSVSMYCRFGLHSLLIRMGHMLNSSPKWKDETQQSVRSDLRQLLMFCRAEPQLAWGSTSSLEKGELTAKLFRFCIILRVREEGFDVLKLIGSDFDSDNFEGIQNDEVAQAIADFVSQVTVWEDVVQLIKPLIFRDRIAKQLHSIMKLAKFLLKTNCVQGANMVGDSVSSFFAELHPTCAAKMKESDIVAYMDMVVSLETNPDSSSRTRIDSFILFFNKLRPSSLQCQLVWYLKTQYSWCLKNMQPFQLLLCEFESLTDLSEVSPSGTENSSYMALTKQTRPEFQSSISSLQNACFEYENPQLSVPYYSPWNSAMISDDPETPSCISGGGFLLERLRELWNPADEGETPTTGGSICSISDYLFQLRDFQSAFKEMPGISAVQANIQQTVFDPTLEGELYITNPIQEDNSKDNSTDEEEKFENLTRQEKFNAETSEVMNSNENDHTISSCTTQFVTTHEPYAIFLNKSSFAGTGVQHTVAPGSSIGRSVNQEELVPFHSPWNTVPKSNHSESSFIPRKGLLLERLRELFNPAVEGEISTTGGSICSLSDYLFQLCDFESAFEDVSSTYVVNASDQPPAYEMPVHPLPIEWVRKLPQVEFSHCRVTTNCADDRHNSEVVVENTSLHDDAETSTIWCPPVPITEPKLKRRDSNHSFGLLIPTLSTSSPAGTNVPSSSIDTFAYRSSESSLSTITSESNLATKAESGGVSAEFKKSSAVGILKTFVEETNSGTGFWNGVINSKEIGKINVEAIEMIASKLIPKLNMPSTLELVGRIKPENIWNYINQTIRSGTRDIVVISFLPVSDSSRKVYSSFIRHMQQKERFAVVGPFSKLIKDFYLVPLLKDSPFPSALNSFSQVFENRTSSMLLGIVIPSRKPKAVETSSSAMS